VEGTVEAADFRKLRRLSGLTQEATARLCGVTHRTILRWEHGESHIGDLQAQAIRARLVARLFGQAVERGGEEGT
jgi:transcriptional regulator with XRE-family HTH domain